MVVNVHFDNEPWNRQSPAERYKGFAGWVQGGQRATGVPFIPGLPGRLGG